MYIISHKEYNQVDIENRKFDKQRVKSIIIVEKIEKLVYRFRLFDDWKIHFVVSVTQLESASEDENLY